MQIFILRFCDLIQFLLAVLSLGGFVWVELLGLDNFRYLVEIRIALLYAPDFDVMNFMPGIFEGLQLGAEVESVRLQGRWLYVRRLDQGLLRALLLKLMILHRISTEHDAWMLPHQRAVLKVTLVTRQSIRHDPADRTFILCF